MPRYGTDDCFISRRATTPQRNVTVQSATTVVIGQNPDLMNKWCKWLLSGWKGFFRRRSLTVITLRVSKIGTKRISTGNIGCKANSSLRAAL